MATAHRKNNSDTVFINKIRSLLGNKRLPTFLEETQKHHKKQIELIEIALRAINKFEWEKAYYKGIE